MLLHTVLQEPLTDACGGGAQGSVLVLLPLYIHALLPLLGGRAHIYIYLHLHLTV